LLPLPLSSLPPAILISVAIALADLAITHFVTCYLITDAIALVVAIAIAIVPLALPPSLLSLPLLLPPLPLLSLLPATLLPLPSPTLLLFDCGVKEVGNQAE
jgi:hypothetical protein